MGAVFKKAITLLFWSAIFLVPAVYLGGLNRPLWLECATRYIVQSFAASVGAATLAFAVKYGSPVLSAILDVDTYLRASPDRAPPRAKIVERYVSLLRYIARYRGGYGRGYDSVVIVAHSLGTLISADLLRFLKEAGDPELAAMGLAGRNVANQGNVSIRLLNMGSPIRQILNRFFPYLHDWVRDQPDNGLRPLPGPATPPPPATIAPNALPNPADLGVSKWVNTYPQRRLRGPFFVAGRMVLPDGRIRRSRPVPRTHLRSHRGFAIGSVHRSRRAYALLGRYCA